MLRLFHGDSGFVRIREMFELGGVELERVHCKSLNPRVTSSNQRVRKLKARVAILKAQVRRLKARVETIKQRVK